MAACEQLSGPVKFSVRLGTTETFFPLGRTQSGGIVLRLFHVSTSCFHHGPQILECPIRFVFLLSLHCTMPNSFCDIFRVKQSAVRNSKNLSAAQQTETTQFSKRCGNIFGVAVNTVYCAAVSAECLCKSICRLPTKIAFSCKQIGRERYPAFDLFQQAVYCVSFVDWHCSLIGCFQGSE